ncbi:uncharacterized protein A4U43_C06F490 [Asparagus officinalis]|uniref:Toprim domain-containing protein n=1 Tax=Asparagus officinalis TaxID=4686 RepID=A0A5P1EIG4_ASPOF|nr:uncharacterized protein A4U43_C06F490 [Asparagus officinalis]
MGTVKCSAGGTLAPIPRQLLCPRLLSTNLRKPPSRTVLFALRSNGVRSPRQLSLTTTSRDVHLAALDAEVDIDKRLKLLREKLEELGFEHDDCKPGQYYHKTCPKCKGGESKEKSFSIFIREDGRGAMWRCFRGKCGWSGCIQDGKMLNVGSSQTLKSKGYRVLTEEDLQLEPLSEEVLAYLKERMISAETLRRNGVMQRRWHNQTVIAFPYRRNGTLVSCKYRGSDKKFWQESDTERIFYGLDDIRNATDIIIVEGEMDKLAMEEAGYRNCVSVPDGAPGKVSKDVPDQDKDTKFQYLWNCKEYLNKASRIILATDADAPGQALAEELARRLDAGGSLGQQKLVLEFARMQMRYYHVFTSSVSFEGLNVDDVESMLNL